MKNLSPHTNVFAMLICLALLFSSTASAIGMASVNHSVMGDHSTHHSTHQSTMGSHSAMGSHASHSKHNSPSTDMMAMDSDHSNHSNITDENCTDHVSCVAECAAHCTTGVISGAQTLVFNSVMAFHAPIADHSPKSVVISGLYKPPKILL